MSVTLYVLRGLSAGKRYVGITSDLTRRLREHQSGRTKAGQLIGDFVLLHTEEYPDHATARAREVFLKSGQGRQWLDELEASLLALPCTSLVKVVSSDERGEVAERSKATAC